MEWLDSLGAVVAVDTAPFIYYIETNPSYLSVVDPFFLAFIDEQFEIVTSTVTLTEVLTKPLKMQNFQLVQAYKEIFSNTPSFSVLSITNHIAEIAAEIRADYNLRTPDALQIATALAFKADTFLTNDKQLKRVVEINVVTVDDVLAI